MSTRQKIVMIFILMFFAFVFWSIAIAEGIFSRQELMNFTWGDGDYQLGSNHSLYYNSEGKYIGPEDSGSENTGPGPIKINNKGEIYIQDSINKRILKYSSNGSFLGSDKIIYGLSGAIAFDDQDNIYLDHYGTMIEKISPDFSNRSTFRYDRNKIAFSPINIAIDDSKGKIYISDNDNLVEMEYKKPQVEKEINGKMVKIQPSKLFKRKLTDEQRGDNNLKLNINSLKSGQQRTIDLKSQKYIGWGQTKWAGEDKKGDVFIKTIGVKQADNIVLQDELIMRYDQAGNLVSEIILDKDEKVFFDQKYLVDIDNEGNVYHLWIKRDGAKLIKWRR